MVRSPAVSHTLPLFFLLEFFIVYAIYMTLSMGARERAIH